MQVSWSRCSDHWQSGPVYPRTYPVNQPRSWRDAFILLTIDERAFARSECGSSTDTSRLPTVPDATYWCWSQNGTNVSQRGRAPKNYRHAHTHLVATMSLQRDATKELCVNYCCDARPISFAFDRMTTRSRLMTSMWPGLVVGMV